MKRILLYLTVASFLLSCGRFSDKSKRECDSLQNVAIGDVKFGMTMQEVLHTKVFAEAELDTGHHSIAHTQLNASKETKKMIERTYGLEDGLAYVAAKFNRDELYAIVLKTCYYQGHYFKGQINDARKVAIAFVEKYNLQEKYPNYKDDLKYPEEYAFGNKVLSFSLDWRDDISYYYDKPDTTHLYSYTIKIENSTYPIKGPTKEEIDALNAYNRRIDSVKRANKEAEKLEKERRAREAEENEAFKF